MQNILLSQTFYKLYVLASVFFASYVQAKVSRWVLNMKFPPERYVFEDYFNTLNLAIFWVSRFIFITCKSISLAQEDFNRNAKWKIALTILSGPVVNILLANSLLALSLLAPSLTVFCNFVSISLINATIISLIPIPPSSGYYLLALVLPKKYRNMIVEEKPNTEQWERHLYFLCFWIIASGMTGQYLLHTAIHSMSQFLWAWQPLVTTAAAVICLLSLVRRVSLYNKSNPLGLPLENAACIKSRQPSTPLNNPTPRPSNTTTSNEPSKEKKREIILSAIENRRKKSAR
ncbi:MAG: hypothetical protein VX112_05990 [Pseudomonadota bacterium]|nr:hypothetical protein [Pseudomonadota bacterium]